MSSDPWPGMRVRICSGESTQADPRIFRLVRHVNGPTAWGTPAAVRGYWVIECESDGGQTFMLDEEFGTDFHEVIS